MGPVRSAAIGLTSFRTTRVNWVSLDASIASYSSTATTVSVSTLSGGSSRIRKMRLMVVVLEEGCAAQAELRMRSNCEWSQQCTRSS